jgi:hypothetical protein
VILKALEKDKNNRHQDVSAMAAALQEVLDAAREASNPLAAPLPNAAQSQPRIMPQEMLETRRGEAPNLAPPSMPYGNGVVGAPLSVPGSGPSYSDSRARVYTPDHGVQPLQPGLQKTPSPYPLTPNIGSTPGMPSPLAYPPPLAPQPIAAPRPEMASSGTRWVWWIVGLLALGAVAGAVLALMMK